MDLEFSSLWLFLLRFYTLFTDCTESLRRHTPLKPSFPQWPNKHVLCEAPCRTGEWRAVKREVWAHSFGHRRKNPLVLRKRLWVAGECYPREAGALSIGVATAPFSKQ